MSDEERLVHSGAFVPVMIARCEGLGAEGTRPVSAPSRSGCLSALRCDGLGSETRSEYAERQYSTLSGETIKLFVFHLYRTPGVPIFSGDCHPYPWTPLLLISPAVQSSLSKKVILHRFFHAFLYASDQKSAVSFSENASVASVSTW